MMDDDDVEWRNLLRDASFDDTAMWLIANRAPHIDTDDAMLVSGKVRTENNRLGIVRVHEREGVGEEIKAWGDHQGLEVVYRNQLRVIFRSRNADEEFLMKMRWG